MRGVQVRHALIEQARSIQVHLGEYKTLAFLRREVWWKGMVEDIQEFIESCHTGRITEDCIWSTEAVASPETPLASNRNEFCWSIGNKRFERDGLPSTWADCLQGIQRC